MRMRRKKILWIVLGALFIAGVSGAALKSERYHPPQALQDMKATMDTVRSWDEQMEVVANFVKQYPNEIEVQLYALGFQMANNPNRARANYKAQAHENPTDVTALLLAGRVAKEPDIRINYASRILAMDKKSYWGMYLTAWYYAELEPPDFDKAIENFENAISIDNSLPYAFTDLGRLYQRKDDKEKADEIFVLLGKMMPEDFGPVRLRIKLQGADYKESLSLTQKFLKEHPEDVNAIEMEARLQRELSDWPGYVEACQRLLQVQRNGGNAYNLACAFSLGGEVDSAFAALELASSLGYNDFDQYKEDEDLIPLRDEQRWSDVLVMVEKAYAEERKGLIQQAIANRGERHEKALESRLDESAPEWTLKDFDGNDVSLAELRGNIVILDFWATWCGPCRKTMPLVDKFYQKNKRDNVKVFGVNVWEKKIGPDGVKAFIQSKGYQFPILFGDDKIASNYGVRGIPTMFIIDPDGKIAYRHVGFNMNLDEVLTWQVDEILKSEKE